MRLMFASGTVWHITILQSVRLTELFPIAHGKRQHTLRRLGRRVLVRLAGLDVQSW